MKKLSYEDWVSKYIGNLADHFNLSGWVIKINFSEESKKNSEGCYACVDTDSTYLHAEITVFPRAKEDFESKNYARLTRAFVHELSHILIDPLHEHMCPFLSESSSPAFNRDLENVTQRIAMVICNSIPASLIPPR